MDPRQQNTIRSRMAARIRSLAICAAGGVAAGSIILLGGAFMPSQAQERGVSGAAFEQPFNISRGRAIATDGARCGEGEPCYPCFQCHGDRGVGDITANFPRLTGQSFRYLYGSLQAFASGALTKGGVLAAVGDLTRGVQACANCHGPDGAGLPPNYPYLAGQYADYLEDQLMAWRKGERGGDPLDIMRHIADRLTEDQIHAVSQYYASIRPSRPVPQRLLQTRARAGASREGER